MSSLSKREKTLIYIMICVIICFVVGFLMIIPAKKKYDKLYDKKGATVVDKQTFALKIMDTEKWEQELSKAVTNNSELSDHFYKVMANDDIDKIFTTYALNNGVSIKLLEITDYVDESKSDSEPQTTTEESTVDETSESSSENSDTSIFKRVNVTLRVSGTNEHILALITSIESNDKVMLQNFTIQKSDAEYSGDIVIRVNMIK